MRRGFEKDGDISFIRIILIEKLASPSNILQDNAESWWNVQFTYLEIMYEEYLGNNLLLQLLQPLNPDTKNLTKITDRSEKCLFYKMVLDNNLCGGK